MESKHNCIDCARAKIEGNHVMCGISIPSWMKKPDIEIEGDNVKFEIVHNEPTGNPHFFRIVVTNRGDIENCPTWYPNTPPQWTLPDWKKEGEYAVLSGVTHDGKRWECFKENGGKYGDAVEPGADANVWREAK